MNIQQQRNAREVLIPERPCVYFLTNDNGDILYVGKSKKGLMGRIGSHQYQKQFSRVFFIECKGFKEMDKMEVDLINKIRPKYNDLSTKATADIKHNNLGMISLSQVKKRINVDGRIVNSAASFFGISRTMIGCVHYYENNIVEAVLKYLGNLDRCPTSLKDKLLWEKCRQGVHN